MGIQIIPPGPADPVTPTGSAAATGQAAAPGAGAAVATTAGLPAGTYLVHWSVTQSGAIAAGDVQNMQLMIGATVVAVAMTSATAGAPVPQPDVQVVVPAGNPVLAVKAIGAATAGTTYQAAITAARIG